MTRSPFGSPREWRRWSALATVSPMWETLVAAAVAALLLALLL